MSVVAGCDVAGKVWVVVVLDGGAFARALTAPTLKAAAAAVPDAEVIAVDIPIGIPEAGTRAADVQARDLAGERRASVFMTPVREAIVEPSHALAVDINRRIAGKGISRQAHGLRTRILEAAPVAQRDDRIYEAHPELSFAALAGGEPLAAPKVSWDGQHRRRGLLADAGIVLPDALGEAGRVPPADVLDAAAVAWTGLRVATGRASRLGAAGADSRDFAIWV